MKRRRITLVSLTVTLLAGLGIAPATAAPTLWYMYGPPDRAVIVTGSGFSRPAYDDEEPHLVVVRVRDGATGEIVTSRRVAASLPRCSPKIGCIGGGSISTGFSAAELGWARYENCELVLIDAFDEFTRRTTPALKTWLSGCIR